MDLGFTRGQLDGTDDVINDIVKLIGILCPSQGMVQFEHRIRLLTGHWTTCNTGKLTARQKFLLVSPLNSVTKDLSAVPYVGNWNFRSHVLSLPGAKVRGNESSIIPLCVPAQ